MRFDGNGFQVFDTNSLPALPGNDVRCLLETPDGALWIGTSEGLARWKDGVVTAFTTKDGLPGNGIKSLSLDSNDSIWIETLEGEAKYKDGLLSAIHTDCFWCPFIVGHVSLPNASWAGATTTMLTLGLSGKKETHLQIGHDLPGSRIQSLFADREGSLWIGTNAGLARWSDGKLQKLPITDSLASASVLAFMEDREGNLWVGTESDGLHILRDQRFRIVDTREGLSSDATTTVVEDSAGTLWVGTNGGGLNAIRPVRIATSETHPGDKNKYVARVGHPEERTYTVKDGLLSDVILSLAASSSGDLWVGTPDGLNRIRGGSIASFTSSDQCQRESFRLAHADLYASQRPGQRPGGRDGTRCERRSMGCHAGWPFPFQRRQDRELYHCERPLQQRDHSSLGPQRRFAADRYAGSRLESVGWAALLRRDS